MLNEDLMTPQEAKIAKLKVIIDNFKKYDEERKKYYKESMLELGQLRSYVEELEEDDRVTLIKNYRKRISGLEKRVATLQDLYTHQKTINEALSDVSLRTELIQLKVLKDKYQEEKELVSKLSKEVSKLSKENLSLRKQISNLVYKLNGGNSAITEGEQSDA